MRWPGWVEKIGTGRRFEVPDLGESVACEVCSGGSGLICDRCLLEKIRNERACLALLRSTFEDPGFETETT